MEDEDQRRVSSIERYEVLRRPERRDLSGIVELAAHVCRTPLASIDLITDSEQHQIATYGFDAAICRREDSMCAVVLGDESPVVVPDASLDERFRDNPFVNGVFEAVRFYASHELRTREGVVIGTLCVFDWEPRTLDDRALGGLRTLAERVVDALELALRGRQLAASNERLASFAGRVSHDLKTPLTGVSLSLGLLRAQLDEGAEGEDNDRLLSRAIDGSERMAAVIDQVLAYAAVDGSLVLEPVDLDRVLTHVVDDLEGRLEGVSLSAGALPAVLGDEVQLRTVVQNLLDNASKYRDPVRPLVVAVTAERRASTWRIAVSDNGRGIPPELHNRVFEPHVRLDDDDRGFGIGLDTCRRVLLAHHGTMGVTDTPGGGATVWFELPA